MARPGSLERVEDWSPFRAYGRHSCVKFLAWPDWLALGLFCAVFFFFYFRAAKLPQYDWQWPLLSEFILRRGKSGSLEAGPLLSGLFTTLRVGCWTFAFSLLIGLCVGAAASRKSLLWRLPCQIYINLARNTPPLVILFCVYFFAGNLLPVNILEDLLRQAPEWFKVAFAGIFTQSGQLDRMIAAVLALGLYQAAYVAEIARGALESVPKGQWDAALALGFSRLASLRLVILPQSARMMLPPLTGQAITTFKDTALASLISLPDLTFQSLEIMAVSGMTFEIWISAAVIYLLLGGVCALAGRFLEKRYSWATH